MAARDGDGRRAFALVREASVRTLGLRHFDVQLVGGIVLHQGAIAERMTGEGKTLVATLPLYMNGLTGRPVYLITVNDYLARRDCAWMTPIFDYLGVTSGAAQVKALEQALLSSQRSLDSTRLGLEVGVRTNVDVLNAQQQLYTTWRDLAVARYQTLVAGLQLKGASGILAETDLLAIDGLLKE